jgi:predicted methyltransferase
LFKTARRLRPADMKNTSNTRLKIALRGAPAVKSAVSISVLGLALGCGPSGSGSAPPAEPAAPSGTSLAVASTPAAIPAPAPEPPAPTPEELKLRAEREQLAAEFAALEQENSAELARLTPEVRAEVKTLVEKSGPGLRSALTAALKGPQRRPGHAERDGQRHPLETLTFLGVQPNHHVLEYGPGEGWYTELLAPVLSTRGKLFVTLTDPDGSQEQRMTLYGKRTQLALASLPEAYSNVERVVLSPPAATLAIADNTLDSVLLFRGAHGMVNAGTFEAWLTEFNRTIKPKGILGIEQHRAIAGSDPALTSKQGYLPEAFVIEQVEKAGFKLVKKSEINANPKDTKDYADGVWALPPSLRGGETDKAKYVAIGESDRMTLKFAKVAKPAVAPKPAATPAAPAPTPAVPAAPASAPLTAPTPAKSPTP